VPLNEDEERILAEIERQFHATDPESARRIGSTTLQRYLARNCRWAALGFLVGLVTVVASFATSLLLAVLGFLVMVACAVLFVQNLNKMSRLGLSQVRGGLSAPDLAGAIDELSRRLRRRLGGPSED
jgi:uncharacterized membrane protein YbhN (UPF0104 family)